MVTNSMAASRAWARPAWLATLAVAPLLTGCAAYHPGGYGGYYSMPQGGQYVPQGAMIQPMPQAQLQPAPSTAYSETPNIPLGAQTLVPAEPLSPQQSVSGASRALPDTLSPDSPVPQPQNRPDALDPTDKLKDSSLDDINNNSQKIEGTSAEFPAPGLSSLTQEGEPIGGDERFVQNPPRMRQPLGQSLATPGEPNPYDYDKDGPYEWLRGRLQFDETSGEYRIQYGQEFDDQYSGVLTIAADDRLQKIPVNSVVLVQGHVDMDQRDGLQKPLYVIDTIKRLTPKRH